VASSFAWRTQNSFGALPLDRLAALAEPARAQWVLFVPVAFGLGIALWFALPFMAQRQAVLLAALAVALAGLALEGLPRRLLLAGGLLLAAGLVTADLRSGMVAAPRLAHRLSAAELVGSVESVSVRSGGARSSLVLRRDASSIDPAILVRLGLPGKLPPDLRPGARIAIMATLGPVPGPALPGADDPARRAWFEGISAAGRALAPPRILAPAPPRAAWLANRRAALAETLQAALPGDPGAIAIALVVGDQGRIAPDLLEAIRVSGLAHLLSVSGFHVGVVVAAVLLLLRRLLALWPWLALRVGVTRLAAVGAGLAGSAYALLSGAEVPAVRAAISAWIVLAALMLGRDPLSLRLLAFAAFVILLVRPESLLGPSFQLSFAAVATIILLSKSPPGEALLGPRPDMGWLLRAGRLLAALLLTSAAIELVLTPIALFHFGRAGAYGVLANLVAIPLTSFFIMPLLGLWLLLAGLGLGGLVAWALVPALDLLAGIASTIAAWPGASLTVPALTPAAFALMVSGALLLGLLAGRLRLGGAPLLAAGLLWALLAPRPDLFVSADGQQVAVVAGSRLYTLRGHRGGYVPGLWAERAAAAADGRLADLPGARCTQAGCLVRLGSGFTLLARKGEEGGPPDAALCAQSDIATSPGPLPKSCAPRWLQLDRAVLRRTGAVAIMTSRHRLDSVAARAGDHPWSPSALPGWRPRLLGGPAWTGVVAE
jgi:competence protein ComEC